MAEISLSPQQMGSAGITPTYYDNSSATALTTGDFNGSGDQFTVSNDGRVFLYVKNAADMLNVTIQTPGTVDGLAVADRVVNVPANSERVIGPLDRDTYGNPFKFAMDDVDNVEIAVLRY